MPSVLSDTMTYKGKVLSDYQFACQTWFNVLKKLIVIKYCLFNSRTF